MNQNDQAKQLVRTFFKNDYGTPLEITDGQAEIFNAIFLKNHNRVNIIASTQYGKSTIVACALILRTRATGENWAILAGRSDKAKIIMEKVIQHTFDNPLLVENLDLDKNEPLERIKRERSKNRITWKSGGEIRTFSAQIKSTKNINDALTGFGSPNIVEDESALIPDQFQTMILRMLGGHADNTLIKIGNPFYRNHFFRSSLNPKYKQIFIDYNQALKEDRYTPEFIEEMKQEAFFDVLYECRFPEANEIDMDGYRRLLTDNEIAESQQETKHKGELMLGFDVGEGGDENVGVIRSETFAEIVHTSKTKDLMATVGVIVRLIKDYNLDPENCFIDKIGIGAGVVSRLTEMDFEVNGINWANKSGKEQYSNLKAENYWEGRTWIKNGGKLKRHNGWTELIEIKYKEDTSGRIKIKSKEEMRKLGIKSPNYADALALTFNNSGGEPTIRII